MNPMTLIQQICSEISIQTVLCPFMSAWSMCQLDQAVTEMYK